MTLPIIQLLLSVTGKRFLHWKGSSNGFSFVTETLLWYLLTILMTISMLLHISRGEEPVPRAAGTFVSPGDEGVKWILAGGWTWMNAALERSNGREMPHYCKVRSDSCHFEILSESRWGLQGEITDDLRQKVLFPFPWDILVKSDRCFLGISRGQ